MSGLWRNTAGQIIRKSTGKIYNGLNHPCLSLTFASFAPASCKSITIGGSPFYVTYDVTPVFIDGNHRTTVGCNEWTVAITDGAAQGTLYTDSGCTAVDSGITGFVMSTTVTEAAGTYTVVGRFPTVNGSTIIFQASGTVGVLTTSLGSGTVEIEC